MAWLTIGGLYLAFLAIGILASRRAKGGTVEDLMVAGRNMPLWLATMTMTATWVDGGYLLGTAEGAFRTSVASGAQGGLCFGLSLIVGGLLFARRMRTLEFTTLVDPFEVRFGRRWAAVLAVPAMAAEVFWSAELLVALGATLGVISGVDLTTAILLSAAVVTAYTVIGGMWSVAYTDAVQLAMVVVGLAAALPFVLDAVGGFAPAFAAYGAARPGRAGLLPPAAAGGFWTVPTIVNWWDVSAMLVFGGIPWNCYFQRVLACRTPARAQWHSILSGLATMALTAPPLVIGVAASIYVWPTDLAARLQAQPADTLPLVFKAVTPAFVGVLGMGAIIGAVTSSFSASILSAGSMFSWNTCRRLLWPDLSDAATARLLRGSILVLGVAAAVMALGVRSVQALWFFTSDLVFVLLVPQLVCALFDTKANLAGSVVAFVAALVLRLGGGEPLFGIPPLIPYPELAAVFVPLDPAQWYDATTGALLFPFKTLAAATGLVLLPLVSRLTSRWSTARPLQRLQA
jgi:solute carrier family 5 (high affinity choline transporter), member 7